MVRENFLRYNFIQYFTLEWITIVYIMLIPPKYFHIVTSVANFYNSTDMYQYHN